jgi:hypothetical protein
VARTGEEGKGRRHPGFRRHLPVFDPDLLLATVVSPNPPGHVPGGHDPVGREQPVIADHTVLERQPGILQPVDRGCHADSHHHHVGLDPLAIPEVSTTKPLLPGDPSARWIPATPPGAQVTPWASYKEAQCEPISGPSTLDKGISIVSTTVTWHPSPAHVEATSAPMNPAPITTTRHASTAVTRRATPASRPACAE